MRLKDFVRPETIEEARSVLRELGDAGMPIAGGTALHFMPGGKSVTAVDITRLGLDGITTLEQGYRIGATTALADVMRYRAEKWALHEVTRRVSTHQIRHVSTIGGNIARVFPWADLPVALLAMDAVMIIQGDEERELPAAEYFESQPARLFESGDLLTAVQVPALGASTGFGYHKETRTASGFSMMTAATMLTLNNGRIEEIRIAAGGSVFPRRLPEIEKALKSEVASEEAFKSAVESGVGDIGWKGREGMSNEYAAQLAGTVLCDVLVRAREYAERRSP